MPPTPRLPQRLGPPPGLRPSPPPRRSGAIATIAARQAAARPIHGPAPRLGNAVWGLLTSVDFAVLQIIVLSLFAVVGMTLRQLPGFAFRSTTDYANEMGKLHQLYDGALGTGVVNLLDRIQFWHIFSSTWFS